MNPSWTAKLDCSVALSEFLPKPLNTCSNKEQPCGWWSWAGIYIEWTCMCTCFIVQCKPNTHWCILPSTRRIMLWPGWPRTHSQPINVKDDQQHGRPWRWNYSQEHTHDQVMSRTTNNSNTTGDWRWLQCGRHRQEGLGSETTVK